MGPGFYLGGRKCSGTIQRYVLYGVKVLNATDLFTLRWLILYYTNFTSVKKKETSSLILQSKSSSLGHREWDGFRGPVAPGIVHQLRVGVSAPPCGGEAHGCHQML